jgi:hypothetical protein
LYNSILISGGTTMFPGFPTRLLNDINKIFKRDILKGKEGGSKIKINVLVQISDLLKGSCSSSLQRLHRSLVPGQHHEERAPVLDQQG